MTGAVSLALGDDAPHEAVRSEIAKTVAIVRGPLTGPLHLPATEMRDVASDRWVLEVSLVVVVDNR